MWILSEKPGAVINLNYVSRIYMEYKTENNEGNLLLADFKDTVVVLGCYETEDELRSAARRLGLEMARTGIGISIQPGMDKIHENLLDSE